MSRFETTIDTLYGIYCLYRFKCVGWWARHVTKDFEKAAVMARLARVIKTMNSLPLEEQERIAGQYLLALDKIKAENKHA